jgi:hypothetical protein
VNHLALAPAVSRVPELVAAAGERASLRFLEFFAAAIRNPHTRRAYARAVGDFLAWCERHGVPSLAAVQPLHVASWIELQTHRLSAPTVKQRLAAVRHLFDWLVTGQVLPVNPAASVRGPAHIVERTLAWLARALPPADRALWGRNSARIRWTNSAIWGHMPVS